MEVEAVAAMGAVIPVEGEAAMGAVIPVEGEAAMGAVVAAPVPVGIWLLRAAQVQAATLPDGAHVRVCAIELDLAASLRLILKDQIAARKWVVPDLKRVSSLAAVSHLLQTGINAHIATPGTWRLSASGAGSFRIRRRRSGRHGSPATASTPSSRRSARSRGG